MSRTRHHSKTHWSGIKADLFNNGGWSAREPKAWRAVMKHRKRRAKLRLSLRKALEDPEGDYSMPLDSKPWIYYY